MGAQVVCDAFSILYEQESWNDAETEIEEVFLTAPDVSHDEFDSTFKPRIKALADHLTVYVSSNDRALLASRLINRSARRGESTLSPDQLQEAINLADLMAEEPMDHDLITLVDVTPVNRTRNFHNFSLETPEFFDDLYLRMTSEALPLNRRIYPLKTEEQGTVYWVLTPGR